MRQAITIRAIVAVVIAVFVVGAWLTSGQLDFGWLRFFSVAVLLAGIVLSAWDVWLWRLAPAQRIPGVPRCIRGTWKGTLSTLWVDPVKGNRPQPKSVYLVVRQTATLVSVKLLTDESTSVSSLAAVTEADGSYALQYLYFNRPEVRFRERSPMHHGSVVLDVSGCPARRLNGHYWTDRDSKGAFDFIERSRKLADDFTEAAELFKG